MVGLDGVLGDAFGKGPPGLCRESFSELSLLSFALLAEDRDWGLNIQCRHLS